MTLEIENESNETFAFDVNELIGSVVRTALELEAFPYEAELSVVLTDNPRIRELNRETRGIDRETDVLSFPMAEYGSAGDFSHLEEDPALFNPESGECVLGDIVISVEKAKEQAEEYGHSLRREIAFLKSHSMYHLMGYDHMDEASEQIMTEKQEAVLHRLSIERA